MAELSASAPRRGPWLFSARLDLAVFGGSALLSLGLLGIGAATGLLDEATPVWAWVGAVVFVDVAHVWSTAWRTYLDPDELRRRPLLYAGTPLGGWVAGMVVYSLSPQLFWRLLAYLAVWHFVRQQAGWVALYRRRSGDTHRLDRIFDTIAIYNATLFPLLWWHANLPREFAWFLDGDFLPGVPQGAATALLPLHLLVMAGYALRQLALWLRGRGPGAGKNLVVWTTWAAWSGGIVWLNSDYAFTVTNVFIHGIPYLALVWVHGRGRFGGGDEPQARAFRGLGGLLAVFLLPLLVLAWLEEWAWDLLVWHDHAGLFPGPAFELPSDLLALAVPLLAVPQLTHYVLDGFIWRVRDDPGLPARLGWARGGPAP